MCISIGGRGVIRWQLFQERLDQQLREINIYAFRDVLGARPSLCCDIYLARQE